MPPRQSSSKAGSKLSAVDAICAYCGQTFKAKGLTQHQKFCKSRPIGASSQEFEERVRTEGLFGEYTVIQIASITYIHPCRPYNGNRTMFNGVIPLTPNLSNWSTGQREVITKLKSHFSNTNDSAPTRKFFLLHGMGGIGKTQTCLKFTEEMSDW